MIPIYAHMCFWKCHKEAPPFPTVHVDLSRPLCLNSENGAGKWQNWCPEWDSMTAWPRNECHVSVAGTATPHVRAYELALDEEEMQLEDAVASWVSDDVGGTKLKEVLRPSSKTCSEGHSRKSMAAWTCTCCSMREGLGPLGCSCTVAVFRHNVAGFHELNVFVAPPRWWEQISCDT